MYCPWVVGISVICGLCQVLVNIQYLKVYPALPVSCPGKVIAQ
jgi:hypothetical protein